MSGGLAAIPEGQGVAARRGLMVMSLQVRGRYLQARHSRNTRSIWQRPRVTSLRRFSIMGFSPRVLGETEPSPLSVLISVLLLGGSPAPPGLSYAFHETLF